MRRRCDWLQTTAEHDVVWNIWAGDRGEIHVDTWMENGSFVRNLTADRCLFGLSSWLSTKSSTATHRTRSTAACLPDNCTGLADSLQQIVDASKFPTLVGKFTQQPSCTIPLWQIEIFISELHLPVQFLTILFNCYWYLGLNSFQRKSRCIK